MLVTVTMFFGIASIITDYLKGYGHDRVCMMAVTGAKSTLMISLFQSKKAKDYVIKESLCKDNPDGESYPLREPDSTLQTSTDNSFKVITLM